jgi:hypothetical protein
MRLGARRELRIATAGGPGAGRFLAVALLDALDAGAALTTVCVQPPTREGGWSVEFAFVADTDGDGFDDGEEVAAGSDPLDAGSTPSPEDVPALSPLLRLLLIAGLCALGPARPRWKATRRP